MVLAELKISEFYPLEGTYQLTPLYRHKTSGRVGCDPYSEEMHRYQLPVTYKRAKSHISVALHQGEQPDVQEVNYIRH